MDINQKRLPSSALQKFIKPLIFLGNRIELLGSAGLQSQRYYGDYDLFSAIQQKLRPDDIETELKRIIKNAEKQSNMYLIEYKIERKDNTKTKMSPDGLAGGGLVSGLYNKFKDYISYDSESETIRKNFTLNKDFPPLATMYSVIDNAYRQNDRDNNINGYQFIYGTPTLVLYKKGNMILVGVRGTFDFADLKADLKIIDNNLEESQRWKDDLKVMNDIRAQYPNATYYGVGHSLGGALVDLLLKEELLSQAVSYNPAVERKYRNNTNNLRMSMDNDALYKTMGTTATNVRVREHKQSLIQKLLTNTSTMGLSGFAYKSVDAHLLRNFEGGAKASSNAFDNVDYIKLDFIIREGNIFRELSIIYNFSAKPKTESLIHSLGEEMNSYIKQKNYYKALKRLFSLYKAQGNGKGQIPLAQFFNSKVGELYAKVSNLKALTILLQHSTSTDMDKKIEINMKDLHLVPKASLIPKYTKEYERIIQREAKVLWTKIGHKAVKSKRVRAKVHTVANLRALIKDKGLAKTMRGYTRWKKNILIQKLKDGGYI